MHLKFPRRRRRVDPLCQRHERDTQRLKVVQQGDQVLEAAAQPVEPPTNQDIDAPSLGVPDQLVEGGTLVQRAADPLVDVFARRPASSLDEPPQFLELVLDLLVVRAHADVDRCPLLIGNRHGALLALIQRGRPAVCCDWESRIPAGRRPLIPVDVLRGVGLLSQTGVPFLIAV